MNVEILNVFCRRFGQKVGYEKTSIFFSKNVARDIRTSLVQLSGFRETNSLGKYLGISLTGKTPKRSDVQYLIDHVLNKLASWKTNQLSIVGRVTLAISVLQAIPIYPMLTMAIPKACLNEIQRIQHSFLLGDSEAGRKFHAVNWMQVTKPRKFGGLGLRKLEVMIDDCFLKLGWELPSNDTKLWCAVQVFGDPWLSFGLDSQSLNFGLLAMVKRLMRGLAIGDTNLCVADLRLAFRML